MQTGIEAKRNLGFFPLGVFLLHIRIGLCVKARDDKCQNCQRWGDGLKPYAESFYKSTAWQNCRNSFAKSKQGLCERCLARGELKPGEIVHHKIHLTPFNIGDPNITLDWNNLELVCRDCHAEEHQKRSRRVKVDAMGRVIFWSPPKKTFFV